MTKHTNPLVLAMQIRTEQAYSYYLDLPGKEHYTFEAICGDYVLLRPGKEEFWSWMEKDLFESIYTEVEERSEGNFTHFISKD